MTSSHRSTLTNLTRNFGADNYKVIFDNQHNGTKHNNDNEKNQKAAMLNQREAVYRGEGASNFFIFMIVMIIMEPRPAKIAIKVSDKFQLKLSD